ncbi:MAG: hypothetical protein COB67_08760 [SAR324 cluster bacterium]|uniref:Uncharacterized protein n=1 Tax=SAR324 cluster bacterium TaxID=2024889 RepID=A0A2A4T215_9DELT|nr:MAG: hypothetical protein COB67_08760 [SAR324 cluster bacterium]
MRNGLSLKKQKNIKPTDNPIEVGDQWNISGIDPFSKLLLTLVPGKRTEANIHHAVADTAAKLKSGSPLPTTFTDGKSAYKSAILESFGRTYPVSRKSLRGRL